jgi:hypothetical protein
MTDTSRCEWAKKHEPARDSGGAGLALPPLPFRLSGRCSEAEAVVRFPESAFAARQLRSLFQFSGIKSANSTQ